jgi:hypothetical protein
MKATCVAPALFSKLASARHRSFDNRAFSTAITLQNPGRSSRRALAHTVNFVSATRSGNADQRRSRFTVDPVSRSSMGRRRILPFPIWVRRVCRSSSPSPAKKPRRPRLQLTPEAVFLYDP